MADRTKIEWTDATWNPITGCSVVSPGCTNCYAMKLAGTRLAHHPSRAGLTRDTKAGPVWTGEVRFNEQWLDQPLRWKKPRMIFVCAHGDLFAEGVPDEWIDKIFAVMALAPQHTFQVLTKRAKRMFEYVAPRDTLLRVDRKVSEMLAGRRLKKVLHWPLPNVWLGVSAEDQLRADERIPDLLATPAAIRWVSAEPLLGPINFNRIRVAPDHHTMIDALDGYVLSHRAHHDEKTKLDWIVAGGESGPDARPMHPAWARSLRDQCAEAGVPFLFKQWGEWHPAGETLADGCENLMRKGERPGLYHAWGAAGWSVRVGKTAAGRMLAGRTYDAFPEARQP